MSLLAVHLPFLMGVEAPFVAGSPFCRRGLSWALMGFSKELHRDNTMCPLGKRAKRPSIVS